MLEVVRSWQLTERIKVKEDGEIEVEIAEGVRVRVMRATIAQVMSKSEPAAS